MLDVYKKLIRRRKDSTGGSGSAANLRVILVSSGDVDPVVAMHGTEAAIEGLGLPYTGAGTGGARRPWFYRASAVPIELLAKKPVQFGNGLFAKDAGVQMGGFVTSYDTGVDAEGLKFEFVTVHSSGHMVPQYAPQHAHHILDRLILGGGSNNGNGNDGATKALSPNLPGAWDTISDAGFYDYDAGAEKGKGGGGLFAQWVNTAMGLEYAAAIP